MYHPLPDADQCRVTQKHTDIQHGPRIPWLPFKHVAQAMAWCDSVTGVLG